MQLLNIIELVNNRVISIDSFATGTGPTGDKIVSEVYDIFWSKCKENGANDADKHFYMARAHFENEDCACQIMPSVV